MLSRFGFLAVLFGATLPLAAEDDETTRLQVKVTTLRGKPIDRAAVIVNFVEGRSVVKLGKKIMTRWEVRTNQEGLAKIPELPQGKVRVQVVAKGYQTFGDTFEVEEPEKTISIKLNPPQPQYSAH
jgi:hypothetical protein